MLARGNIRKHTPIVSQDQYGLFIAAYEAKKSGHDRPSYVPESLWNEPLSILKCHIDDWNRKKNKK